MSRIEQIKLEIEKRKLTALVSPGGQSDCNIDGSNLFNGHTLGASIDRASWHSAMLQMKKSLPEVRSSKELIDNQFLNVTNILAGCRIKTDVGKTIAFSHILMDGETSQYPLELGALNDSCPTWKYSYFHPITKSALDEVNNDHESVDESYLPAESSSNLIDDDESFSAEYIDEIFPAEDIISFALPFPMLGKIVDLLPIRASNGLSDIIARLDPENQREAELIFDIDRVADGAIGSATIYCTINSDRSLIDPGVVIFLGHFEMESMEATARFESMLAQFASLSDKVRHDAESD